MWPGEKFKRKNEAIEIVKMILVQTPNFTLDKEWSEWWFKHSAQPVGGADSWIQLPLNLPLDIN